MPVTTQPLTAETLLAMQSTMGTAELLDGKSVRMSPAVFEHGSMTLKLARPIARYVEEHQPGIVCAAETGFLLKRNPDTVRAPDLAFVSQTRGDQAGSLKAIGPDVRTSWPKLSPHTMQTRIQEELADAAPAIMGFARSGLRVCAQCRLVHGSRRSPAICRSPDIRRGSFSMNS